MVGAAAAATMVAMAAASAAALPEPNTGGGGGSSYVDSSAIAVLANISGGGSPGGSNGEVIISSIPVLYTWALASGTSGDWASTSSWSPSTGAPASNDSAAFSLSSNPTVTISAHKRSRT